jgi:hypothetical protein
MLKMIWTTMGIDIDVVDDGGGNNNNNAKIIEERLCIFQSRCIHTLL